MVHDYAVLLFGSAAFKLVRLAIGAVLVVHMFACGFYRVKVSLWVDVVCWCVGVL
jgi:hypothetical protein